MNRAFSWVNPKLEIKDTGKYGRGVFCSNDILKDEVVMVMGGYITNTEDENTLGEFITGYNMDISKEFSFCPLKESDLSLMPQHIINHSCNPNVGFLDQLQIIAIKDIKKNEEIVYDYAFVMWFEEKSLNHFEMKCLCSSSNCRGVIRENDWMIPDLQKKYGDYFQPFIKKLFK